jgi:hypothetical protein
MRKIHLVESTVSWGEEGGKYICWNVLCPGKGGGRLYLANKCRASRNNDKIGPFLTKTPSCLGFLVFHILLPPPSNSLLISRNL